VDIVAVPGRPGRARIAAICGEALKPVSLELGGKSAAIVLDDVDLSAAAAGLGCLCFANSGRRVSPCPGCWPRGAGTTSGLGAGVPGAGFMVGDPMARRPPWGRWPVPAAGAVESSVTAGVTAGARIVPAGAPGRSGARYYYEPTVFADADAGMAIARDEIWGRW